MPVQATPPIQLDPSMDKGHELAFINQNFNNIASALSQNSFVIVQSGTTSVVPGFGSHNNTDNWGDQAFTPTLSHNLGYVPYVLWSYSKDQVTWSTGADSIVPYSNFYSTGADATYLGINVTSSTLRFQVFWGGWASAARTFTWNALFTFYFKYYILQQTASS